MVSTCAGWDSAQCPHGASDQRLLTFTPRRAQLLIYAPRGRINDPVLGVRLLRSTCRRRPRSSATAIDPTETCAVEGCCSATLGRPHFASVLRLRPSKWIEQIMVEDWVRATPGHPPI